MLILLHVFVVLFEFGGVGVGVVRVIVQCVCNKFPSLATKYFNIFIMNVKCKSSLLNYSFFNRFTFVSYINKMYLLIKYITIIIDSEKKILPFRIRCAYISFFKFHSLRWFCGIHYLYVSCWFYSFAKAFIKIFKNIFLLFLGF